MKLLYIHQHFVTNEGTGGTRSYSISRAFVEAGRQVTVITGIFDQGPFTDGQSSWFRTVWIDGIKVIVCNVPYSNYQGFAKRLWAFGAFVVLATIAAIRERGVDLVFATSTPLTVGWPGLIAGYAKRKPFVFEVRDIWPEDLVLSGAMKPGLFARIMTWMEELFYRRAVRVLTVSPGFTARLAERGVPERVLETVPLGGDDELYAELEPDRKWLAEHGLSDKMVAVYAGAHGMMNGLEYVVEAATHLRHRNDIAIVLVGDGMRKPALREMVQDQGLTNVVLADPVPRRRIPSVLSACDVGLLILRDSPSMQRVLPNKLFDYMFAGLPTVTNFPGTSRGVLEEIGAGLGADATDPADLAAVLERLADDPEARNEMGRRARRAGMERFSRQVLAHRLMWVFEQCVSQGPRRTD